MCHHSTLWQPCQRSRRCARQGCNCRIFGQISQTLGMLEDYCSCTLAALLCFIMNQQGGAPSCDVRNYLCLLPFLGTFTSAWRHTACQVLQGSGWPASFPDPTTTKCRLAMSTTSTAFAWQWCSLSILGPLHHRLAPNGELALCKPLRGRQFGRSWQHTH